MRLALPFLLALAAPAAAQQASERAQVLASDASAYAVTVYRDPEREEGDRMDRTWPEGFAMISETRTVKLPAGRSTILFEGVAEGMVAVSAIVTGLPGGTIEKNRNADLLSPAALVDRTLGNRVTITRTNPGTGISASEEAVVRTRADGGLVLQTRDGFEAVRCSGLPEKLTFDRVPLGLSANPVFSLDTQSEAGGTYEITLTYLAWGFDWEANYVATLGRALGDGDMRLSLMSWLTVLNDNGQSFPDAELMAVAGTIEVRSDFEELADAPEARRLQLTCYPLGSTATGSPVPYYGRRAPPPPPPPPSAPPVAMTAVSDEALIVVTGSRVRRANLESAAPVAVIAAEEQLGDLKLYRIPEPVTVSAKGMKQVAFLSEDKVTARLVYLANCDPNDAFDDIEDVSDMEETRILFETKNIKRNGLGKALPMGEMVVYESADNGGDLVAKLDLRDYPIGQDVELELGESAQVYAECARVSKRDPGERSRRGWTSMRTMLTNANSGPVIVRLDFGWPEHWEVFWPGSKTRIHNGQQVLDVTVPANDTLDVRWRIMPTKTHWNDIRD